LIFPILKNTEYQIKFLNLDLEGIKGESRVLPFMGMQATSKGNMPVVLLKEGGTETKGRDAQKTILQLPKLLLKLFILV
jgi:thermosome subunit